MLKTIFFPGEPQGVSFCIFPALERVSGVPGGFHRKDSEKLVWKKPGKYWIELWRGEFCQEQSSDPTR